MTMLAPVPYDVTEAVAWDHSKSPRKRFAARRLNKARSESNVMTSIVASAQQVKLGDRTEARRYRSFRQGWQEDAWSYHDAVPEVGFAYQFLSNCMMRVTAFPAIYPANDPEANPVPLINAPEVSPEIAALCTQAMTDFAKSRREMSAQLESLSTNLGVPGEGWILGMVNPQTGQQEWSVRSIDEILVKDDKWQLREIPSDPMGTSGWIDIPKATSYLARVWIPHPRYKVLANSPMRRLLDTCEELLLLNRSIRASARSRIAGNGILKIPENLRVWTPDDDNEDPESDPFIGKLATAMLTPITDEGVASAVVPIIVSGEAEGLKAMDWLVFDRPIDPVQAAQRAELRKVLAVGLDLPAEVITGAADLNHWSLFQIDDNTFREHVEPHIIRVFDALTASYYRNALLAKGVPAILVQRMCLWYNAVDLVQHPDKQATAMALYNLKELSGKALRRESGFSEEDAPSPLELELRMAANQRTLPPNLLIALFHALDPALRIPAITAAGQIPGITATGLEMPPPPITPGTTGPAAQAAPDALPAGPASHAAPAPASAPGGARPPSPVAAVPAAGASPSSAGIGASGERVAQAMLAAITASAASEETRRLSRKLADIDRDLRVRLQTSANGMMMQRLARAGAKLRSRVGKDESDRLREIPNTRLAAALGHSRTQRMNLTPADLIGEGWDELKVQWNEWVPAAQEQALRTAMQIAGMTTDDEAVGVAKDALAAGVDRGWTLMSTAMDGLASTLLYNPHPSADPAKPWGDVDPNQLVPTGTVRAACAVAGGASPDTFVAVDGFTAPFETGAPVGQIGTGQALGDLLSSSDAVNQQGYEWVHGPSLHPLEGHLDLDGQPFDSFDDDVLANPDDFPENAYYMPGDHPGCMCDFTPLWMPSGASDDTDLPEDDS